MSLDANEQNKIEVPPNWEKGALLNCPYYLTLEGYAYHFWDQVYIALREATDSWPNHHNQGPCRRPCETSGPISAHDILLTRGIQANNASLGEIINRLVKSMPQIEVSWE